MSPILTSNLVVTAVAQGSVVWYTIHPSEGDKTELRTFRFSGLDMLHERLAKEVPAFPGRLPPKTMRKNTKPIFIETRRKAIEMYLRLAFTDQMVQASSSWHQFFGDLASTDQMEGESSNMSEAFEGSKDEAESFLLQESSISTVNAEVRSLLQSKRNNLTVAQEGLQSLEDELKTISDSVLSSEAEAKDKVAAENEAAARLRTHRESLAELDIQISVKSMTNNSSGRQQSEKAQRLVHEMQTGLYLATSSKNKAQNRFEIACKAAADASAKAHAYAVYATAAETEAEATHADALAMSVLQVRAQTRLDDVSIAERELQNLQLAQEVIDAKKQEAEDLHQKADVETKAPAGALASHIEQSACRSRAHKLEITRLRECSTNLATLRDMRTRELLMGVDCSSLEPAENASNVAAEAAAFALAKATQAAGETKSRDECQLEALQAVAASANKKLRKRETVVASLAARSVANKVAMEYASAKLAATAPNNAIQQCFVTLRQQVETFAQAWPECSANLAEATKALAAVAKEHESELHLLRHAEQVESQVLQECEAEEAAFAKSLREAQIVAAEAAAALEPSTEEGPDFTQLVKSSEARLVDLDEAAQVAAHGCKAAVEAIEILNAKLSKLEATDSDDDSAWDESYDDDETDDGFDESSAEEDYSSAVEEVEEDDECEESAFHSWRSEQSLSMTPSEKEYERDAAERKRKTVALSSRIEELEQVMRDKKNVEKTTAVAVNAAKEELGALREQLKATFCSAEELIKQEIDLVDSGLACRKDNEVTIVAEVQLKVAAWMVEQETLGPDLHWAQLRAATADADVTSNKNLAKSLAKARSI